MIRLRGKIVAVRMHGSNRGMLADPRLIYHSAARLFNKQFILNHIHMLLQRIELLQVLTVACANCAMIAEYVRINMHANVLNMNDSKSSILDNFWQCH